MNTQISKRKAKLFYELHSNPLDTGIRQYDKLIIETKSQPRHEAEIDFS